MIVFPMAGLSSRFSKAGYSQPKYMLPAGGRSLFDHSVRGFERLFNSETFLFIYRNIDGTAEFVKNEVRSLGIQKALFVELSEPTRGQAETVKLGLEQVSSLSENEPLTIFNIDTIRPNFSMPTDDIYLKCDGWIEVFKGSGDNWSFVEPWPGKKNTVKYVSEKIQISDLCCTGLYNFSQTASFLRAFHEELREGPSHASEFYVAPLYNRLLEGGADLRYFEISPRDVLFSGVPTEYELFKKAFIK